MEESSTGGDLAAVFALLGFLSQGSIYTSSCLSIRIPLTLRCSPCTGMGVSLPTYPAIYLCRAVPLVRRRPVSTAFHEQWHCFLSLGGRAVVSSVTGCFPVGWLNQL
jgi:hypothetical protein